MEEKYNIRPAYLDYLYIVIGTGIMGCAFQLVFSPNNLVIGGFSGLAILIKALTGSIVKGGIPLWVSNLALNAPVFALGWKIKGTTFIKKTLFATLMLSFWFYVIPEMPLITKDFVLVSVFGGVVEGIGLGLVFTAGATTGGTDMVGAIIQHFYKHVSFPVLMGIIDGIIIIIGGLVLGAGQALYAVVTVYISAKISGNMIEGMKFAKSVYIISNHTEEVAQEIMKVLDRGMSSIYAKGMYTGNDREILYIVIDKKQLIKVKEIVGRIDPAAFVIVNDAREVMGEGFLPIN